MAISSKPTLRSRITLYIIVGIFVPIVAVSFFATSKIQTYIEEYTKNTLLDSIYSIKNIFEYEIGESKDNFINGVGLLKEYKPKDNQELLARVLNFHRFFEAAILISSDGKMISGIHNEMNLKDFYGFDFSHREFYLELKKNKNFTVTSIQRSIFTNEPILIYAMPFLDKYIVVHLSLTEINNSFKVFFPKSESIYKAIITDMDGNLIFNSDSYKSVEQIENLSSYPLISMFKNEQKTFYTNYSYKNEEYIGNASNIVGTDWILAVFVTKKEAFKVLEMFKEISFVLLFIFLVIIAVFYRNILANIISPISLFELKASRIANGEYNIQLPNFYYHEISKLADNFNAMNQAVKNREIKLNDFNQNLEQKIEKAKEDIKKQELIIQENVKRKSLEDLLIELAHQWRQPLNVCAIEIQSIEDVLDDEALIRKNISNAMKQIKELSSTITKLTTFYEAKDSNLISFLEGLELSLDFLKSSFDFSTIKVDVSKCEDINLFASSSEWVSIFSTFIYNTRDIATQREIKDAKITIEARTKEGMSEIVISDNAGGIDEGLLPKKLFEPYVTTAFKARDKGLGLYLVYNIIKYNLDGSIEAKNTPIGAQFIIRIKNA